MRWHRTVNMRKAPVHKVFVHHFRLPRRGKEMMHISNFAIFCIAKIRLCKLMHRRTPLCKIQAMV